MMAAAHLQFAKQVSRILTTPTAKMNVIRHRRSFSRGDLPRGHRRHDLVSARKFCQTSVHLHAANHKSICPHLSDASHCICICICAIGIHCDLLGSIVIYLFTKPSIFTFLHVQNDNTLWLRPPMSTAPGSGLLQNPIEAPFNRHHLTGYGAWRGHRWCLESSPGRRK